MLERFMGRIRAWEDAYNNGNIDALDEFYDKNVIRHVNAGPDVLGLEAIKAGVANVRRQNPDVKYTFEEMLVDGDRTASRWTIAGTNTGSASNSPIPPTGKAWVWKGSTFQYNVNGKVIEEWVYQDMLRPMQQIGVIPSNEELLARNS